MVYWEMLGTRERFSDSAGDERCGIEVCSDEVLPSPAGIFVGAGDSDLDLLGDDGRLGAGS